ncbi:MAG: hypothetical protein RR945_05725 [Erysipelotrichaceae bacterium]
MKFTIYELAWLCQIIKVKKLVGFDAFPMLEKEETDVASNGLINKQIIKDGKLTEMGLSVVETINLYVNARRFMKLGEHSVFANYQSSEYILITKTDTLYSINMVTQDMIVSIILSKFKTLSTIKDDEYKKRFVSKHKFAEIMEKYDDAESIFYYMVDLDSKEEKKAVMFVAEGYFQHYDAIVGELEKYPRNQVQQGIESIFVKEDMS